ncbi:MAG: tRNA preQ1(34) S-adenosylmethionine ribosyltransferase-isomerase QueA [Clostridiales bacterium]|nr:tRNA preQ1(34) S-adenosylmethionine ribosyltransferase-isomerase QueA [Clostridiales bacterium]
MKTSDFHYHLPEELIAQTPLVQRDQSRMLVYDKANGRIKHQVFSDLLSYLRADDVLVLNRSRVIPARLLGVKQDSGIACEILLLKRLNTTDWESLIKPGRRLKDGAVVLFGNGTLSCTILSGTAFGGRIVRFTFAGVFEEILDRLGQMPLPPYIHEQLDDKNRYQTIYAKEEGSAAAPTAGLHFTDIILHQLRGKGVKIATILLHVGLGTFRPVKEELVEKHIMHEEWFQVNQDAADLINQARAHGGRIVCVGTTCVRTLETIADDKGLIKPSSGNTNIFITPGYRFRAVDLLLTNFHLPQSTLLMLVSAFMGREEALKTYEEAVKEHYRFFSFGDCMLIGENIGEQDE